MSTSPPDLFTVDEIAQAAGVPRAFVEALVESGALKPLSGTAYFPFAASVDAGREARLATPAVTPAPLPLFSSAPGEPAFGARRGSVHTLSSSFVHVSLLF